jgi:hypothetical protein
MNGKAQVHGDKQRLDEVFKRASAVADMELSADLARYLCVLVSGFLEQAVIEILSEHTRRRSDPSVQKYVGSKLYRFTTANSQNLSDLVGSFDADWHNDLKAFLIGEHKDSVDSVVNIRQAVSHGRYVGVTMAQAKRHYLRVKEVVDHIADLCLPV